MKRSYRKHTALLIAAVLMTACGAEAQNPDRTDEKYAEPTAGAEDNMPGQATEPPDEQEPETSEDGESEPPDRQEPETPEDGESEPPGGQESGASDVDEPRLPEEGGGQEGNQVIRELSPEEWEQVAQNEAFLKFHDGDGGYLYIDPEAERIYHQEIYAHKRAEGSEALYFHPQYSSRSDDTMFAESVDESGGARRYDVYVDGELLIAGLSIDAEEMQGVPEYVLDVCYDAAAQEVLLLIWHDDSKKKEMGFYLYHASAHDDCIQPLRFYPILTGEAYQEHVVPEWIWSALLTPEAIYYDILPVRRIDTGTGDVTEWGLTGEAYTELTGINGPFLHMDRKFAGDGHFVTIMSNPDPAFGDFTEFTMDTYLIYTEEGELVCAITNVH